MADRKGGGMNGGGGNRAGWMRRLSQSSGEDSLSLIHLSPGAIAAEPRLIPESQGGAGDFP